MAFRLKFSSRALREIGKAQEWYELQSPDLGEEFIAAMELQLKRLEQAPLLYAEVITNCSLCAPSVIPLRLVLCGTGQSHTYFGCVT